MTNENRNCKETVTNNQRQLNFFWGWANDKKKEYLEKLTLTRYAEIEKKTVVIFSKQRNKYNKDIEEL